MRIDEQQLTKGENCFIANSQNTIKTQLDLR